MGIKIAWTGLTVVCIGQIMNVNDNHAVCIAGVIVMIIGVIFLIMDK
jgi:hypothetical protein